jgi:hypothetical protein
MSDLGTGLVPNAPEVTADQIAGAEALEQAAQVAHAAEAQGQPMPGGKGKPMGQAKGKGEPSKEPGTEPGKEGEPKPGNPSQLAKKGGASDKGSPQENQKQEKGELQLTPAAQGDSKGEKENQDAASAAKKFEREPWFAKLPPSLRSAIQSKSRGKTPRGYEERLKRYFESVE